MTTTAPDEAASGQGDTTVTVYPDGPLLVRGPVTIRHADGTVYTNARKTVALCRCGKSGSKPWCDGTHKVLTAAARR